MASLPKEGAAGADWVADESVPEIVRLEYAATLEAFRSGKRSEAYSHLAAVLEHYCQTQEDLPPPVEELYTSILLADATQEGEPFLKEILGEEKAAVFLEALEAAKKKGEKGA
ncbi:MAG: hypothetical protein PW734_09055 [Verrucomicrobium sp.]|nr:hypothetical protein [Verrucomicrobium sp.]